MKNKVSTVLLGLIIIFSGILICFQIIPSCTSVLNFAENVKYEILGGYVDDYFVQREIVYPLSYSIFLLVTYGLIAIFALMTIFKKNMVKTLGAIIVGQNIGVLLLEVWNAFGEGKIDITYCLCLLAIFTIIVVVLSLLNKLKYPMLVIASLIQCINTIYLLSKYINVLNNIFVIMDCFSLISILILYWFVCLTQNKYSVDDKK